MRLEALQKPEALTFPVDDGGPTPVIFVRLADDEYRAKLLRLAAPVAEARGLVDIFELRSIVFQPLSIEAHLGTYVTGWRNLEDVDGNPLPDRTADGKLNEANGLLVLGSQEVLDAVESKLREMRTAKSDRLEALAKNSRPPSLVN